MPEIAARPDSGPIGMTVDEIHSAVLASESSLNKHYWLLFSIAYGLQAQNVFEFGAGGSTGVLLAALEQTGGNLVSCDLEPFESLSSRIPCLRKAARSNRWAFLNANSSVAVNQVGNMAFDLVLHDGSHEADQIADDLAVILPRLKQFGILLLHDVEQFALGAQVRRGLSNGLRRCALNVSMTSLPYSDGLAIVRMESDTGRGRVSSSWCKQSTRPAIPEPLPWLY